MEQPHREAPASLLLAILSAAQDELWRRGLLSWKLHPDQFRAYEQILLSRASRFVLEIARRWGKTWLLCVIAIEVCLRNPKGRVVYGAPTLKHLAEFIIPTIEKICEDAPPECRPVWNSATGHFTFPNGAYIHLFGADDKRKAGRGRGPAALLAIFDECGFTPILLHVLRSIFRPQLLHTGQLRSKVGHFIGMTLLGSTPAEEPDHDFTAVAELAEKNGTYLRRTIHDNPLLTPAQIEGFIADDARDEGLSVSEYVQTDTFRREYMAERVVNKLLIVVPEWANKREKLLVRVPRPEFFNAMTVLDMGGADPHALTFGYWHFELAKWVVEGELLLKGGENSRELVEATKAKETELWGVEKWDGTLRGAKNDPSQHLLDALPDWMVEVLHKDAQEQPFTRWSDNDLLLVRDLYELHGIAFIPTAKDDKEHQVNNLRVLVNAEQLLLDPSCVHTDRQLRTTTWENHKRRTFARRAGEHGDLVDTLIYGARNLDRRNPFPEWHQRNQPLSRRHVKPSMAQEVAEVFMSGTPLGRKALKRR